jgi:hypothetical protein
MAREFDSWCEVREYLEGWLDWHSTGYSERGW